MNGVRELISQEILNLKFWWHHFYARDSNQKSSPNVKQNHWIKNLVFWLFTFTFSWTVLQVLLTGKWTKTIKILYRTENGFVSHLSSYLRFFTEPSRILLTGQLKVLFRFFYFSWFQSYEITLPMCRVVVVHFNHYISWCTRFTYSYANFLGVNKRLPTETKVWIWLQIYVKVTVCFL